MTTAFLGLGANLGRPQKQLRLALRALQKIPGAKLSAASPLYFSAPQKCPGGQPQYCNAAAALQTFLPPQRLHARLQKTERSLRRKFGGRKKRRNTARHLDIDYLFHGCARLLRGEVLTLPHPRVCERAFVLRPLADIAGNDFRKLRRPSRALRCARALRECKSGGLRRA